MIRLNCLPSQVTNSKNWQTCPVDPWFAILGNASESEGFGGTLPSSEFTQDLSRPKAGEQQKC